MVFDSRRTSPLRSAVLVVSMRWTDRLVGLLSTIILARLLVPDDFGIIAMASLTIGLVEVLLDLGVNVALVQNRAPTPQHYDTAWTLRLAQTGVAAVAVAAAAAPAAGYFGDPRIVLVLYVMALALVLGGLENIGVVTFQKEMRFGLDFRLLFSKRLAGFVITIAAAWLLRSYWALVIGTIGGRLVGVVLSYQLHPMRPRLSLSKLSELFSVSQWTLLNGIAAYLNRSLHKFGVARVSSSATTGAYALADDISAMPASELLAPLNRVLFPAFVEAKENMVELKRLYLLAQALQTMVAVPACVGLALVAHDAVLVLLGRTWLVAVPFVQLLSLANIFQAITTSGGYVILTMGHFRKVALLNWTQVLCFVLGAAAFLHQPDALEIATLYLAVVGVGFVVAAFLILGSLPGLRPMEVVRSTLRPLLGTAVMAAVLFQAGEWLAPPGGPWLLGAKVAIGIATYIAAVAAMWWLAGKPAGAESYFFSKLGSWKRR